MGTLMGGVAVTLPEGKLDSAQSFYCVVCYNTGSAWDEWDKYSYHSKTGRLYYTITQQQKLWTKMAHQQLGHAYRRKLWLAN